MEGRRVLLSVSGYRSSEACWRRRGVLREKNSTIFWLLVFLSRTPVRLTFVCTSKNIMSWQSYVDDHLIGTGHVTQAAICGVDGALWAASAGFNVRPITAPPSQALPQTFFVFCFSKKSHPSLLHRVLSPDLATHMLSLLRALAGAPRGGGEDRGGNGRPVRAAGGGHLRGRREVHVHPQRRPPHRGEEGASTCR
jgi:hypothetical protein